MESDAALLSRVVEGRDAEAFAALANRYARMVYTAALRVTGNSHDAEEVAQECFLALARQAGTVRSSLPGWLHRMAVNRAINLVRAETRRRSHEAARPGPSTAEATWVELAPHVDEAIEELPDELREAVVLHFLHGQSQDEIAEGIGVSQATVSRRVEKGVDGLRDGLRRRGLLIGAVALGSLLAADSAQAAPAALSVGLGKLAASGLGVTGKTAAFGVGAKVALAAVGTVAAMTIVGVVAFRPESPPPTVGLAPTTTLAAVAVTPATKPATTTTTPVAAIPVVKADEALNNAAANNPRAGSGRDALEMLRDIIPPYVALDPLRDVPDVKILNALQPDPEDVNTAEKRAALARNAHEWALKMESRWDEYGPAESEGIPFEKRMAVIRLNMLYQDGKPLSDAAKRLALEETVKAVGTDGNDILTLTILTGAGAEYARLGGRDNAALLLKKVLALMDERMKQLPTGEDAGQRETMAAIALGLRKDPTDPAVCALCWNAWGQRRLAEKLPRIREQVEKLLQDSEPAKGE